MNHSPKKRAVSSVDFLHILRSYSTTARHFRDERPKVCWRCHPRRTSKAYRFSWIKARPWKPVTQYLDIFRSLGSKVSSLPFSLFFQKIQGQIWNPDVQCTSTCIIESYRMRRLYLEPNPLVSTCPGGWPKTKTSHQIDELRQTWLPC